MMFGNIVCRSPFVAASLCSVCFSPSHRYGFHEFHTGQFYTLFFFLEEYCFSNSGSIFLIFWRFEAKNILKMFLEYRSIEYVCQHGVVFLRLQMIAFTHCATFWYMYCTMYHVTYISSTSAISVTNFVQRSDMGRLNGYLST